jgi:hypothetical protein
MLNVPRPDCFRIVPCALAVFTPASVLYTDIQVSAQFIKEIDADGNVSYTQDPSYDYSSDEPTEANRRINEEQLRQLREFIDYRANRPAPERRPPQMTIRTGSAVCNKRISLLKLKTHGCN